MTAGCRLAWLIDPEVENVHVYRADGSSQLIGSFDDLLTGGGVLPELTFVLSELRLS